tara:strand:+ start:487 stop:765 length:279 start_codon:yes stop_codon:yes gene_type:complete
MTQLTKPEIVKKTQEFLDECRVLVDDVKRTKQWLEMAVCTEPGIPAMEKRLEEKGALARAKFDEFEKWQKENPFDDAPMTKAELFRRQKEGK